MKSLSYTNVYFLGFIPSSAVGTYPAHWTNEFKRPCNEILSFLVVVVDKPKSLTNNISLRISLSALIKIFESLYASSGAFLTPSAALMICNVYHLLSAGFKPVKSKLNPSI